MARRCVGLRPTGPPRRTRWLASGRQIALYAAGEEALVVRWTAVALIVQVASAVLMIPMMGGAGAAISVAIGDAAVWLPLRRAGTTRAAEDPHAARPAYERPAEAGHYVSGSTP